MPAGRLGIAMGFLTSEPEARARVQAQFEASCSEEGITVLGWRLVPIETEHLGERAHALLPVIMQAILHAPESWDLAECERRAFRVRRRAQARAGTTRAYYASCSFVVVTYKALVMSDRLGAFYPDLVAPDFTAPLAVFHSRFSTNTAPSWERAQPFRMLCHNGEINTLAGNEHRMNARGELGTVAVGLGPESLLHPILDPDSSDSGKLDNALELLVRGGRDVRHALAMLVPEAWEGQRDVAPAVRDFYRYHACIGEPWDGPAGLIATDGVRVVATLDRNGLRPLRWQVCEDGTVICASEVGAVPLPETGAVRRGRLGPGQMLCVDPEHGVQFDDAIKGQLAELAPYSQWVEEGLRPFRRGEPVVTEETGEAFRAKQVAYGVTKEECAMVLKPMATDAKEPTFSMGDDTPFAAVARTSRPVAHFFRQRFAQVTNPPIDHLRERLVMTLRTLIGPRPPLLYGGPEAAQLLELPTFFLYPSAVARFADSDRSPYRTVQLDATFSIADGPEGLARRIRELADAAEVAIVDEVIVLVISDAAVSPDRAPVPSLLALGAVQQRILEIGRRDQAALIVDAGDARDVHAIACLLGVGADAICPRVGLQTVAAMADDDQLGELHAAEAQAKYQAAIEDGVLKIMSKMGISSVAAYRGALIFEALGLGAEVVHTCFPGLDSAVDGLGFAALGADVLECHARGFADDEELAEPGWFRFRKRGGEYHANNPEVVEALQSASGVDVAHPVPLPALRGENDVAIAKPDPVAQRAAHVLQQAIAEQRPERYETFRALVEARPITELRDLLELAPGATSVPIAEVEPVEAVLRRFSTGAMSHGSLSREAHETLAIAMNMIGGRSNCGEGGEDPFRFRTRGSSQDRNSRIKQIASGRFGVTPEYVAFADELNIKMAQGSKPGEGGQLPGHKVSEEIARLRYTQPGVGLISPPPHHDIYSIEDLAQLIYDLKQVNPSADVSVKLVAETGIGQIAAGVVKALADVVQISGANGGTGASPLSSIKHAGMPWELGLTEVHRTLHAEGLRSRVRLRVDGGFKTGRDVVIAALLGADEFSFGTAAMLAEGCIMVRACHRDTCPTGIATQRPQLRAKFAGTPEGVAQYFVFVAEEVRALLATLGCRTLAEAIGRTELLTTRAVTEPRAASINVAPLLVAAGPGFVAAEAVQRPRSVLDETLLLDGFRVLWDGDEDEVRYRITNADRSVGASLGGAIGLEWGSGLPPGTLRATFTGQAGQSFGAFCAHGMILTLHGEANDYVAKGMGGGRIVICPPADDAGDPVLAGNTVLYGATGGQLFLAGRAGERFAVRNSGAHAVVEGVGDHGCEYMTGGTVVVLGSVGYNFGAGMTGGQAFVYDPRGVLQARLNRQLVDAYAVDEQVAGDLRFLLERHVETTGSARAQAILADWDRALAQFWRVAPVDEVARIERANEAVLGSAR
ncbi:MAG: glutamate synthase-related protein [Acidimicrobiia bacterium]